MASPDEAMGGESSSDPLSPDDEEFQTVNREEGKDKDEEDDDEKNEDSSSISSEDSFESDLESESFTDVTPLHSISNSPLPTQPINTGVTKVRDLSSHPGEENTADDSSESSSDDENLKPRRNRRICNRSSGEAQNNSKVAGKISVRRPTVKRAPTKGNLLQQNRTTSMEPLQITSHGSTGEVAHLADAIQKLGLRNTSNNNDIMTNMRSRRQREHDRRLEVENEKILKRIIAQQSRVAELVSTGSLTKVQHVAPSTVNRKRQQKYIHAQNLALHKRIEASRHLGAVTPGNSLLLLDGGSSRKTTRSSATTTTTQLPSRQKRRDSR